MAELSNLGSGSRAKYSSAAKQPSVCERGKRREAKGRTDSIIFFRASSSLIIAFASCHCSGDLRSSHLAPVADRRYRKNAIGLTAHLPTRYSETVFGEVAEWLKAALC